MKNTTQTQEQIELIVNRCNKGRAAAQESIAAIQKQITERMAKGDCIASKVSIMRQMEGQVRAYSLILRAITSTPLDTIIADALLRGVDDRWSGRTNDLNRAVHDGLLEALQTARYSAL